MTTVNCNAPGWFGWRAGLLLVASWVTTRYVTKSHTVCNGHSVFGELELADRQTSG